MIAEELELITITCQLKKDTTCIVASVYRPPRVSVIEFIENLANFVASLGNCGAKLILVVDTNICAASNESNQLNALCSLFSLQQLIKEPTHKSRIIDQIFVSAILRIYSSGIAPPIEKTHVQTWAKLFLSTSDCPQDSQHPRWIFRKADWLPLNLSLMRSNILERVAAAIDTNAAVCILQTEILKSMVTHIPRAKLKGRNKGWINNKVIQLHKERCKLYKA
jgi:hypothetical protein